jgi:hypothetical protein
MTFETRQQKQQICLIFFTMMIVNEFITQQAFKCKEMNEDKLFRVEKMITACC